MTVPPTSNYEILETRPAKTGSSVVLSMRETETGVIVGPVYSNPPKLRLPVVVGKVGRATFEHRTGKDAKPGDKGYLVLDVWCEVGGTPPHPNPTGGQHNPNPRPTISLDGRDRSIIAQSSMKAAADFLAQTGLQGSDSAEEIIGLASKLSAGVIRIMNE